jgi:20S proteasome alpha/beta subunit
MTTIAWDGKTLAADRRATGDGAIPGRVKKIFRTADNRLLGIAGCFTVAMRMVSWLSVTPDMRRGRPAFDSEEDFTLLEVMKGGRIWVHGPSGSFRVRNRIYAIGSGQQYAVMAMHLGCTAVNAVKHTIKFDENSGFGVDFLHLKG